MASYLIRLIYLLTFVISALVVYDLNKHGSFSGSQTEQFFNEPQKYTKLALTQFRSYSQQAYRWSRKNVPQYITRIREGFIPFLHKLQEVFVTLILKLWNNIKLVCQYVLDKKPILTKWMNRTAPGLSESVALYMSRTWALVCDYSLQLAALIMQLLTAATHWLRDNVFVGGLSPENLQRFTMEALNTTQNIAAQTLSWLSSKVVPLTSTS